MDPVSAGRRRQGSLPSTGETRFEDLYRRHYSRIFAYCVRRIARSRVDDAVADVFTVVWRRIDDVPRGDGQLIKVDLLGEDPGWDGTTAEFDACPAPGFVEYTVMSK